MKDNVIQKKSFEFTLSVIKVYKHLFDENREYVLSKQLLKAGTSIGANVNEAIEAQSKPDFISKMPISLKEARETQYWIRLLTASGYLTDAKDLNQDLNEIISILTTIIKTSKGNYHNEKH